MYELASLWREEGVAEDTHKVSCIPIGQSQRDRLPSHKHTGAGSLSPGPVSGQLGSSITLLVMVPSTAYHVARFCVYAALFCTGLTAECVGRGLSASPSAQQQSATWCRT
jgi:hypothetical protein